MTAVKTLAPATGEAVRQIREAAAAKKCWTCGCFHSSLQAIQDTFREDCPAALKDAIEAAKATVQDVEYDCLGCETCYPALAVNALEIEAEACPTECGEERDGWPPLPGAYTVNRYRSPVAVCTLTDGNLADRIASSPELDVAVAGTMQTENLGIERLLLNVLANPNIRFLVVCGPDSQQKIGHLPGQSLVALARNGLDERGRIPGARGKRPRLRNVSPEAVAHFRRTVEVVDLVGCTDLDRIRNSIRTCTEQDPGPAEPFNPESPVKPVPGYLPERTVSDPSGYVVIYVDRRRNCLSLEHYRPDGSINAIVEGQTASEVYTPAIERTLVSRLDHAAYLGKELARAEQALRSNSPYVQDAAPERGTTETASAACGCQSKRRGNAR